MNEEPKKPCACEAEPKKTSRRDFLLAAGFGLNAIAGAMIGIPLVGYVLSSFFKPNKLSQVLKNIKNKTGETQLKNQLEVKDTKKSLLDLLKNFIKKHCSYCFGIQNNPYFS